MRLSELVAGLAAPSAAAGATLDPEISGLTNDSRKVRPGDLYVALPGARYDGRAFAAAAVVSGAAAVAGVGDAPAGLAVPWVPLAAPRAALGPLAARLYGHPDRELTLAGVTGTNGKTTTATLLAAVLSAAGRPAGFIGTLGATFDGRTYGAAGYQHTTPEASDLFRTLRAMHTDGAWAVAMEVSSHAIEMGRVAGAQFDVAAFTNLTRDHLDYHGTMDGYYAAKRRLFDQLKPGGRAAVNVEDPYGRRLAAELPDAVTFGEGGAVSAASARLTTRGTVAEIATPRGRFTLTTPLLGRYNLLNLLAVVAAAEALALPHAAVVAAAAAQRPIAGRLEPIDRGQPFPVFVDYAHTDAALEAALRSVREVVAGKVAVVFGCGGERDAGKRPLMGKIAGELADLPIVTSDNPRGEDPQAILRAVEEGLRASGNERYRLIPDRREAIREAIAAAGDGWAVLVAGKGHETEQVVGDRKLPFSDLEEIGRALDDRFGGLHG